MQRITPSGFLFASLVLAFFVYYQGTSGYFLFDDTINILENTRLHITSLDFATLKEAAFSGSAGIFGRPLSVLSFAINYYLTGLDPYYFKLTNIAIHLLNGVCIYILTNKILHAHQQGTSYKLNSENTKWISAAVAALWLLHPLNLTGVLYIVQRMTSLTALFTLLGLIHYIRGRQALADGKAGWGSILASVMLFTPLAAFSKENGVLLPVFALTIEFIFFKFRTPAPSARLKIITLFGVSVFLPFAALTIHTIINPKWITNAYILRDFTLTERLLTEARVLWLYLQFIIAPDISKLGMYHDDIALSKSLFDPPSTIISCIGIILIACIAFFLRKKQQVLSLGIIFFLVGHSLESSVIALELAHEHRNYLPIFGVLLPFVYYILNPTYLRKTLKIRQALTLAIILLFSIVTFIRSTQWGDHLLMKEMAARNHPDSIRSNVDIGAIYASLPHTSQREAIKYYQRAHEHFSKALAISPSDTLGLFGLIGLRLKHQILIDEPLIQELEYRIEKYPFAPNTGNSLANLEECLSARQCNFPEAMMERLLQAALRNPTLQGRAMTQVLFAWSNFLFTKKHDRETATKIAYEAMNASPTALEFRLTLIAMLINMGKIDEAEMQIKETRQLDTMRLHTTPLRELEEFTALGK